MAEELHGLVERLWVGARAPSHVLEVVPPMPTLIPHDLSNKMLDRQSDLQEAMSVGDSKKMLELTSLQSQGAEKLAELTGGMVSSRSHGPALMSRIASYKNLGDGDKQTEDDDDDETVIDLKEYTCVEKIWRQWDDHADSLMSECRLVETKHVSCFHCTARRCF